MWVKLQVVLSGCFLGLCRFVFFLFTVAVLMNIFPNIKEGSLLVFFHFFPEWHSSKGSDQVKNASHRNRGKRALTQLQMVAFLFLLYQWQ